MPKLIDFYQLLGVPVSAKPDLIRQAFRKLALKYHPDRNPGDRKAESYWKRVSAAYDVLIDDQRRAQYDRSREVKPKAKVVAGRPTEKEDILDMFGKGFRPKPEAVPTPRKPRCPLCKGRKVMTVRMGIFVLGGPCMLCGGR